jgi:hypothetical protein
LGALFDLRPSEAGQSWSLPVVQTQDEEEVMGQSGGTDPIWHEGDRVDTTDGRRGRVDGFTGLVRFPVRVVLDGEEGVFVFAHDELTRIKDD